MAQAKLISPVSRQAYERTKVAAYCRVSSNSADQLNSYATQIRAYTKPVSYTHLFQLNMFIDYEALERDRKLQGAMLEVRRKFGSNALFKGMNLMEGATTLERNQQIGGHKA